MWLLVNDTKLTQVLCANQEDALEYIKIHKGIWIISIVEVWTPPPPRLKDKDAKLGRDFKPMSQD